MRAKTLLILTLFFLWILISYGFLISFHNVDLAVNICNLPLIDESLTGKNRTIPELYKNGLKGMFFSFIISNIIFFLTLTLYLDNNK